MAKASVTSKGQITIPKEIRDYLELEDGNSSVKFTIQQFPKAVLMEKVEEKIKCPICKGQGLFHMYSLPCFVCDQTGYIDANVPALRLLVEIPRDYKVGISIIQQEIDNEGNYFLKTIPEVQIKSNQYNSSILEIVHDFFQMKLIEEFAPRDKQEPTKFMNSSDEIIEGILGLLIKEESKEIVKKWFR
ncbi:AbrB/MazE/SpoVT family DNA-binding domain-containing protein [Bacillus sp. FJAT-29937]|uniref:AbrB/MazE/SpoVT family DNA-binding domain-containing protein n=1 Tax=Bacillus sp. FJAT-29937 TaxID=1720553 RepID=UPI00082B3826|nr:AbrB/MazE/SpoVT family DNA-binding domain-containing protein [Bacillus sp. FJAT-29937]